MNKRLFLYFDGGLGDVIHRLYGDENFNSISLYDEVHVLMASHNPFAYELFALHPCAERIRIFHAGHTYLEFWKKGLRNQAMVEAICKFYQFPIPPESGISSPCQIDFTPGPDFDGWIEKPFSLVSGEAGSSMKSFCFELMFDVCEMLTHILPTNNMIGFCRHYPRMLQDSNFAGIRTSGNLAFIQPATVPTSFHIAQAASIHISCHSSLAQLTGFSNIPTFIIHPNSSDFNPENFGKGYTHFYNRPIHHGHATFGNYERKLFDFLTFHQI